MRSRGWAREGSRRAGPLAPLARPSPPRKMLLLGVLGALVSVCVRGSGVLATQLLPPADCVEAEELCASEPRCQTSYHVLEYCASEEAVAPLGPDARRECVAAEAALLHSPLLACKCQRGTRKEEQCLRVYWTVRYSQGYYEYEASPYEETEAQSRWSSPAVRMAPIVSGESGSTLPLDSQNQCLKAAQDCGLYEKCGALRSEYVLACTKRAPSSSHCNRQKCHRALRRFLERVPEEYVLAVLFCRCSTTLCGERRRKTIVPSCSYEEREKPNCLSLQGYCMRDDLCRARLADFQRHCQPSALSASGCVRESGAACLRSYIGLIGTIMTPNYISNSSDVVSQWCTCEGSGNQWQDCERVLRMFTSNACLRNAITSLGSSAPRPVESTTPPPTRISLRVQQNNDIILPDLAKVEDEEEDDDEEFNVIPPYSEKATESNARSVAPGPHGGDVPKTLLLGAVLVLRGLE
ncbi:GDNF family receptor alpha-3 isoform X1 [Lepisosteus oculatus]|uniref:GDNF family receptor alpha-3 isoform X1 n=1 Tax=Lepisosteus oculatus TaxID=7918 RepID=UPI0035F52C04